MLKQIYESDRSEFVAVYGRRRVGKTYLIKQYFKNRMDFYVTGICDGTPEEQYANFNRQLCEYSKSYFPIVDNWFDALLMNCLGSIPRSSDLQRRWNYSGIVGLRAEITLSLSSVVRQRRGW